MCCQLEVDMDRLNHRHGLFALRKMVRQFRTPEPMLNLSYVYGKIAFMASA